MALETTLPETPSSPRNETEISLLDTLRTDTREAHASLEAKLDLLNRSLSLPDYARLLEGYARIYAKLEPWIEVALGSGSFRGKIRYAERRKGAKIFSDRAAVASILIARGSSARARIRPAEFNFFPESKASDSLAFAAALGFLYVLEGSTLGGRVLVKHFRAELPELSSESGLAFFSGYGDETGSRWRAFTEAFGNASANFTGDERRSATRAANAAFALFERTLSQAFPNSQGTPSGLPS